MNKLPKPTTHTVQDYLGEMRSAYSGAKEGQLAPRITDPTVAYSLGHELVSRLGEVDEQYRLDLETSETADDPIGAKQEDLMRRQEGLKRTLTIIEGKHLKATPDDFVDGERHFKTTPIDPAMRQRMEAHRAVVTERELGRQIDAMGLDSIDPNHSGTGLIEKRPEDE
jgi:hypothetical protein